MQDDVTREPVWVREDERDDASHWPTGRLLSTTARLAEHDWDSHLGQWQLNHSSFAMLALTVPRPMTQRDIAQHLHVAEQTVSRTVERLERLGYVTRERGVSDRRSLVVKPTDLGIQIYREARDGRAGETVFDSLGPRGIAELRTQLTSLLLDLSAKRWGQTS